uniref:Arrestin-like N-terminal domain-containing protein n=1 Tax=Amphora coffeiformis TaxID=265554 RepID=A0A7S3P837_9STRA
MKEKAFHVDIVVDQQPSIASGSILSGKVTIVLSRGIQTIPVKSLQILLEGQEQTRVTYAPGKEAAEVCGTIRTYAETHPIFSHVLLDRSFEKGLVESPSLTWSFQCPLPPNLPACIFVGSVESTNRHKPADYASVSYQVKVIIEQRGFLKDVVTFEQPLQVTKNPQQGIIKGAGTPYEYMPPLEVPKKSMFGFKKYQGKVYIAARLPLGVHVRAGPESPLDLSIINCSKKYH